MTQMLKRTPLHNWHRRRGAKMVPFGGWEMPVQYTGIVEEHNAVRRSAGLFDVSHMGEFRFRGPDASRLLQHLTTNDVARLEVGQLQYSMFLNPLGGTIDDTMIYRIDSSDYLAVVNASNVEKDWAHVSEVAGRSGGDVELINQSEDYALLALQGPLSEKILARIADVDPVALPFHHLTSGKVAGAKCLVAASGYTGENGFEIFLSPQNAEHVVDALMEAGAPDGLKLAGLGARDTLRVEASLALYGHELDERTSPLEARLEFAIADKEGYIGEKAIRKRRSRGLPKRLVMLELTETGIPRQGCPVLTPEGNVVGEVTSGTFAPYLKKSIAMAFVPSTLSKLGREFGIDIRGKVRKAVVVRRPFYRRPQR